jgi:hypothetical protein
MARDSGFKVRPLKPGEMLRTFGVLKLHHLVLNEEADESTGEFIVESPRQSGPHHWRQLHSSRDVDGQDSPNGMSVARTVCGINAKEKLRVLSGNERRCNADREFIVGGCFVLAFSKLRVLHRSKTSEKLYPKLYPRNGKTLQTWYTWTCTVHGRKP